MNDWNAERWQEWADNIEPGHMILAGGAPCYATEVGVRGVRARPTWAQDSGDDLFFEWEQLDPVDGAA